MGRRILGYLGCIEPWMWLWGIATTSAIGVLVWAVLTRLPGVLVFVLAIGTGVLMSVGLETALMVYEKIKELRGWRYRKAVIELQRLGRQGVMLLDRPVTSEVEVKFFAADVEAFEATALDAMQSEAVAQTDISWFQDFHLWAAPQDPAAFNGEHALLKAILGEKLRRMHEMAERLQAQIYA